MELSSRQAAVFKLAVPMGAVVLGSVLLSGCIIIPVDYHAAGSRRNITMESTNLVQIGTTTRTELLLTWGEPDFASEDGRRFGYLWTKVKVIWAVASYGGAGAGGECTKSYLIETSFDESDHLSKVTLKGRWGDSVPGTLDADEPR